MSLSKWNLNTRIHPLRSFPPDCYIKRDDELSCSMSGTKLRKYASLMPTLVKRNINHLLIIAGPQSNNLLAAVQMVREYGMSLTAFLIKPWAENEAKGNFKFSQLFLDDQEIIWIDREDWSEVELLACRYAKQSDKSCFILKEGASVEEAMPGAMTLGDDIIRNECESSIKFDHVFVDAGTGFAAAALIKSLREKDHSAMIHVLLLADSEALFYQKLRDWIGMKPENVTVFYPQTSKAFGAVNQTIKQEIRRVAREEGVLLDPIYSAKLFHAARHRILHENLAGNKLIVHSGGLLSLTGFDF